MRKIVLALVTAVIVLIAIAAMTGWLGLWPVAATSAPPNWENSIARATRRASLNRQSKGINNPSAPSNETLLSGVKLYRNVCAGCHGSYGHPSHWGTRNFYPRVPQFAEQSPRLTASQMFVAIKYGIRYSGMGGYDGELSEEKMWAVATLLEHLDSLPPEVKTAWMNKQ